MAREKEERILVSVRLRPLNAKEIARNDLSDWECVDNTTIVFKNTLPERTMCPASYTFDRIFGCECNTRQVYNEGAKQVVLSVVNGINASIFAYGQTSSGKTYTMTGITKYAVKDIYDYIKRNEEREFVLKFSAMEIYNEAVRDLLSCDSSPLRLLDDSEGGTVVEKLTEETLRDRNHLNELLSLCEAQRQVGETSLNEMSSRSHQILRLTIESIAKQFTGKGSSSTLLSALNFVDLAGSERASQVSFGGARQKEGCHINRSLLTLGTVIRKLSKGRTGHIPYRDSKLTRILQPFLGGNGRTAIICTMSPARSHIEQSRNTLSFASCAKQVVTNAQVNAVMSDKALVRHLQRELTRLENEQRYRESETCTDQSDVLKDKDAQIQKMEREIEELMHQIDLAQSRHEYLLRAVADDQASRQWDELSQSEISHVHTESEESLSISGVSGITNQIPDFDSASFGTSEERSNKTRIEFSNKINHPWSSISSQTACEDSELCKEVQCIDSRRFSTRYSGEFNILMNENDYLLSLADEDKLETPALLSLENINLVSAMEQPTELVTSTSDNFVKPCHDRLPELPWVQEIMNSRELVLHRSRSCKASLMNTSILSWLENVQQENKTHHHNYSSEFPGEKPAWIESKLENDMPLIGGSESGGSESYQSIPSIDVIKTDDTEVVPLDAGTDVHSQSIPSIDEIKTDKTESIPLDPDTGVHSQSIPSIDVIKTDDTESVPLDADADVHSENIPSIDVIKTDDTDCVPLDADADVHSQSIPSIDVIKTDDTESVPLDADTDVLNTSAAVNLVEEDQYQKQLHLTSDQDTQQTQLEEYEDEKVNEDEGRDEVQESSSPWPLEFERKQREIIELWHACNVSLTHRTCFFLFFKGDPADAFYMEVECRKLAFLRNSFTHGNCVMVAEDGHGFSLAARSRHLRREREMLCREMKKKLPTAERKKLYAEWGIAVTSKQRRLQLVQLLWTRTDMEHVRSSASLVAKLIGFVDQGDGMKEMFALSFAPQPAQKRSFRWCHDILVSLFTLTK